MKGCGRPGRHKERDGIWSNGLRTSDVSGRTWLLQLFAVNWCFNGIKPEVSIKKDSLFKRRCPLEKPYRLA